VSKSFKLGLSDLKCRACLLPLAFLSLALTPHSYAQDRTPVVAGWGEFPPHVSSNTLGEPEGFAIDLLRRLREIVGFDYRFEHYRDAQLLLEAQRGGSTQIFAGVATLPVLKGTNLFSDPVANTQVRLFVRADRAEDPVYINPRNKRIGIVPPGAGAEGSALLTQNRIVEFPDDSSLFVDLLRGGIDGALVPQERLLAKAHSIGLDHRIVPVGEVVQRFDRVVAVHESRAVLMPAINAAIRKLEASGELESLREKWFLD